MTIFSIVKELNLGICRNEVIWPVSLEKWIRLFSGWISIWLIVPYVLLIVICWIAIYRLDNLFTLGKTGPCWWQWYLNPGPSDFESSAPTTLCPSAVTYNIWSYVDTVGIICHTQCIFDKDSCLLKVKYIYVAKVLFNYWFSWMANWTEVRVKLWASQPYQEKDEKPFQYF